MRELFWTLLFLTSLIESAYPCSSFVLKKGSKILLGKNFDWTFDQGYVIKNLKNTTKVAYYTHNGKPASWTSKYGSITFNQNGKEMPYGGMNERGLVIEMLWLDDTRFNMSEEKIYLNELEWIQYQLDNFQTVDEVVANIETLKIYPIKGKIHYILADTQGKSIIIEYLDGKSLVYEKEANSCQAITNKTVVYSEKYIEKINGIPKKNTSPTYRYHKLEKQIKKLQSPSDVSEETAFQMLNKVSIPKGDFKTVWSIVYNVEIKAISFYSHSHKIIKQINLNNIDFEKGLGYANINQDTEIILDNKLEPFNEQANFKVASASLIHLGFEMDLTKGISEHQFNQNLTTQSYFSQNYFHLDISIPMTESGKRLVFVVMDSEENFNKKVAVTGSYISGTTVIGTANRHIYGLKNGRYSMIALIDENKNSELDFDNNGNPTEKYATFSHLKLKSMSEITFESTSKYFTKDNCKLTIQWK